MLHAHRQLGLPKAAGDMVARSAPVPAKTGWAYTAAFTVLYSMALVLTCIGIPGGKLNLAVSKFEQTARASVSTSVQALRTMRTGIGYGTGRVVVAADMPREQACVRWPASAALAYICGTCCSDVDCPKPPSHLQVADATAQLPGKYGVAARYGVGRDGAGELGEAGLREQVPFNLTPPTSSPFYTDEQRCHAISPTSALLLLGSLVSALA